MTERLAWLDAVSEEVEEALSPAMRELLQSLRKLKRAEEGSR